MADILEPTQVGFLVIGDRCDRCGDVNFDKKRVCLTCTHPDDPMSRAYLGPDIWIDPAMMFTDRAAATDVFRAIVANWNGLPRAAIANFSWPTDDPA